MKIALWPRRLVAFGALGAAVCAALAVPSVGPATASAQHSAAGTAAKHRVRFTSYVDHTVGKVDADTHQRVSVTVRLIDQTTKRRPYGNVWLVDPSTGQALSPRVKITSTGFATVGFDPAPATLPGTYRFAVQYGGSGVAAPRRSAVHTYTIKIPPRDATLDGSLIAAPDYLNEDIGDISGMPNWTPAVGNSWNQQTADSISWVLKTIASYHPGAFLVTGDNVNGRWGNPDNNTGVFGGGVPGETPTDAGLSTMLANQARFYYGQNMAELRQAGLASRFYPAIGDHELGDNWWNSNTRYGDWKRKHMYLFRDAFNQGLMTDANGKERFADHPVGTEWDKTAYATMINPETLLVSVDEFRRNDADPTRQGANIGVFGGQLAWLDNVLSSARRRGVRWLIVQGHTPVLPAKVWHSSGLHVGGGRNSGLWQVMKKNHVNLYIGGEVHTTSRNTADGITQLITGAPLTTGQLAFATIDEYHDRLAIQVHAWDVHTGVAADPLWQGGCPTSEVPGPDGVDGAGVTDPVTGDPICTFWSRNGSGNVDYSGIQPTVTGSLTVYYGGTTGPGTGTLVPWTGTN